MTFAGTRTRGSACGCCDDTCGICEAEGDIAFCLRISGVAPDAATSCAECLDVNDTYSGAGISGGGLILDECNNCALSELVSGEYRFPPSIRDLRACYKTDFTFFNAGGVLIDIAPCGTGDERRYYVRAAFLKPGQAGMDPGTAELHILIYRHLGGIDRELLLHAKYVFSAIPFDCQNVDWTEMEIIYLNEEPTPFLKGECDWSAAALEFKFGGECGNGSPAEDTDCCEGTEMPGTLYATTSGSAADVTDEPIGYVPIGGGFQYSGGNEDILLQMFCSSGTSEMSVNSGGTNVNVPLTIISCDPFHAIGSASGIDVEITS
jgi:hypothetical protein